MARENLNREVKTITYKTEVQGTVVRKVEVAAPERRERIETPISAPNRRRNANLSIPYCLFLAVACMLTLGVGAFYLQQQALATSSQKTIASLEGQLAELKKENADNLNRIETSVNLEEIRNIAINELGMVYATEENVVLYENTKQNYVSQYEEVPQEEESLIKSIIKSK